MWRHCIRRSMVLISPDLRIKKRQFCISQQRKMTLFVIILYMIINMWGILKDIQDGMSILAIIMHASNFGQWPQCAFIRCVSGRWWIPFWFWGQDSEVVGFAHSETQGMWDRIIHLSTWFICGRVNWTCQRRPSLRMMLMALFSLSLWTHTRESIFTIQRISTKNHFCTSSSKTHRWIELAFHHGNQ